jgi:uncharacterized membrane protein
MINQPVIRPALLRPVSWVALALSVGTSAIYWLLPLWGHSALINAVFGYDWLLPMLLLLLLTVVGFSLDIVAMTKRRANIVAGAIAALILVGSIVESIIYSHSLVDSG